MRILINNEEHDDLCVGIDLGTTNSVLATINTRANGNIVSKVLGIERAVGTFNMGQDVRFEMRNGETLPSCVYYNEEKAFAPVVGDFAKSRYSLRPHLVAKSIKSQMGNAFAQGLSPDIPDKTPAEISAQILKHMIRCATRAFHQRRIEDAVITIPANFDSIMRSATLKAAELAGIKIYNRNGDLRSILLEEPHAVIYDLVNQVRNGEIASQILDFSTEKIVMVFDLGGGTLDITLHAISCVDSTKDVLIVKNLAINPYTPLGGDDFDKALAREMFSRYVKKYSSHPTIQQKIRSQESNVMAQLLSNAEFLKIKVSMDKSGSFGTVDDFSDAWGDDVNSDEYEIGLNIGSTGVAYDDVFRLQEFEEVLKPFMGEEFSYNDFKRLDEISATANTQNIIFPILNVLAKCAKKLGRDDFKIDAVIMNGGMSRFYMVRERLTKFFGFDPIVALDPDQSVARGAAVYHYFLHKYEETVSKYNAEYSPKNLDEYNKKLEEEKGRVDETPQIETVTENFNAQEISKVQESSKVQREIQPKKNIEPKPPTVPRLYINPMRFILPDSLYLVTEDRDGNKTYEEIIEAGTELPYESKRFTGFSLPKNTTKFHVPIARKNLNGEFKTIARGEISFLDRAAYKTIQAFVSFTVQINEQKILHMRASTYSDEACTQKIDEGTAEILVATHAEMPLSKVARTHGTTQNIPVPRVEKFVDPVQTLQRMLDFCRKIDRAKQNHNHHDDSKFSEYVRREKAEIFSASNPEDFAEPILKLVEDNLKNESFKLNVAVIGRKIGMHWTAAQRRRFAYFCMMELSNEINGFGIGLRGAAVNTKIQAIQALYMCGSESDLESLSRLHQYSQLRNACLYTHAMTKTDVDWIYEKFNEDYRNTLRGRRGNIQYSVRVLGYAYRLDERPTICSVKKSAIVEQICKFVEMRAGNLVDVNNCIIALGALCDQRFKNPLDMKIVARVQKLLDDLNGIYEPLEYLRLSTNVQLAQKMIEGSTLSEEEEEILLIKISD